MTKNPKHAPELARPWRTPLVYPHRDGGKGIGGCRL
jgi:hypothetical protein